MSGHTPDESWQNVALRHALEAIRKEAQQQAVAPIAAVLGLPAKSDPEATLRQLGNLVEHCYEVIDSLMAKAGDTDFPAQYPGVWQDTCQLLDDLSISREALTFVLPRAEGQQPAEPIGEERS